MPEDISYGSDVKLGEREKGASGCAQRERESEREREA
jgi:hypothetical protein